MCAFLRKTCFLGEMFAFLILGGGAWTETVRQLKAKEDLGFAVKLEERKWYRIAAQHFLEFSEKYPESRHAGKALGRAAKIYERVGDFEGATDAYQRYMERYASQESRAFFLRKIGDVAYKAKRYRDARVAYEEMSRLVERQGADENEAEENLLQANYRIAWCLKEEGALDRAIDRFRKFIIENLESQYELLPMAQIAIAECYLEKGDTSSAVDEFRKTFSEFPRSSFLPNAHLGLAEAYLKGNDAESAAQSLDNYLQSVKGEPKGDQKLSYYWLLAETKRQSNDLGGAAGIYQMIASSFGDAPEGAFARRRMAEMFGDEADSSQMTVDALWGMAQFALTEERSEDAFKSYKAILTKTNEKEMRGRAVAGMANAMVQADRYHEAGSCFLYLWERHRDYEGMKDSAYVGGISLYQVGAFASAAKLLGWLVTEDSEGEHIQEARSLWAESLFQNKEFDKASEQYKILAQVDGETSERAQFRLAACLLASGQHEQARAALVSFIESYPTSEWRPDAEYRVADTQYAQEQYRDAALAYLSLVERFPQHSLVGWGHYQSCLAAMKGEDPALFDRAWNAYLGFLDEREDPPVGSEKQLHQLGFALYQMELSKQCSQVWNVLLDRFPEYVLPSSVLYWLAGTLEGRKVYEGAARAYRRALGTHLEEQYTKQAQYGLANSLVELGEVEEALSLYQELQKGEDAFALLASAGTGKCLKLNGSCEEALEPLAKAAREAQQAESEELKRVGAEARYLLAACHKELGQLTEAREMLDVMLALSSYDSFPDLHRAVLFLAAETEEELENWGRALELFKSVASDYPQDEEGRWAARKVKALEDKVRP